MYPVLDVVKVTQLLFLPNVPEFLYAIASVLSIKVLGGGNHSENMQSQSMKILSTKYQKYHSAMLKENVRLSSVTLKPRFLFINAYKL